MDPFSLKRLGRSDVSLPRLGFGGAGIGNIAEAIGEASARATVTAAWDAGIRYYDTSPWYGRGLSEHRVGSVLYTKPRQEVTVSTKVGRILTSPKDPGAFERSTRSWQLGLKFEHHYDYSYNGIMRSYEDSMQRLAMNRVDMLIVHDLDQGNLGSDDLVDAHLHQLVTGGFRALTDLRSAGLVKAVGAGVNRLGTIPRFLDVVDLDFFLVALPYTLAEQPVLDVEFPQCEKRGVGIIVGAPFASGILATGVVPGARYNYREPTAEEADRIRRIEVICRSFEVTLASAALQFPLHHPSVISVIPGAVSPEQPARNIETIRREIPNVFWARLKREGLLREDAPTP